MSAHTGTNITIVVDNKADGELVSEHGLSMWIESGGARILFDTGQGTALENNARVLGVDLARTDILVLSHGHYDHTGAFAHVITRAPGVEVYCHPDIARPRYAVRNDESTFIGISQETRNAVEALPSERLHSVREPLMLTPAIGITGPVPRLTNYEDTGGPFFLDSKGALPDLIEDDLALWIQTEGGTVVCLGCAHAGLINTLNYIQCLTGNARIRAVIGGFHLVNANRERLDQTVAALRTLAPDLVAPCHCTGDPALAFLKETLGDWVSPGAAGMTYRY